MNGGQLQNRSGGNAEVTGAMEVVSESMILNISGNLDLRTSLFGNGDLVVAAFKKPGCRTRIRCSDEGYSGNIILQDSAENGVRHKVEFDALFKDSGLVIRVDIPSCASICVLKDDAAFARIRMPSATDFNTLIDLPSGTYNAKSLLSAGVDPSLIEDQGGTLSVGIFAPRIKIDSLFQKHMVLQRNKTIPVFGTAPKNTKLLVEFGEQLKTVVSDSSEKWVVNLDPMSANKNPQELVVRTADGSLGERRVSDLLVGDVWLCGGQSNMDSPVRSYPFLAPEFAGVTNPLLRLFVVRFDAAAIPQEDVSGDTVFTSSWLTAGSESIFPFSAVGMCFGQRMQKEAGVPIGLIESAVGGSPIKPWIPAESLEAMGLSALQAPPDRGLGPRRQPSMFYNGMIHPLRHLPLKGVIWYQGESNADKPSCLRYDQLFKSMITAWRDVFNQPDLPFYFVQLAPRGLMGWDQSGESWAWLREGQEQALDLPNTGRVVLTDLSEYSNIHPENKRPVGERLAELALRDMGLVESAGFPRYAEMQVRGERIQIRFSNCGTGLHAGLVKMNKKSGFAPGTDPQAFVLTPEKLEGFTLCGADRTFVPARARIVAADIVEVWSPEIENPVAVRYGWHNFPLCNLENSENLPASPFRTDHFPAPQFRSAPFLESSAVSDGSHSGEAEPCLPVDQPKESRLTEARIKDRDALRVNRVKLVMRMGYFKAAKMDDRNGNQLRQRIVLTYLDDGPGVVEIKYDAASGPWKSAGRVEMKGTGGWRQVSVEIDDAWFAGRCNGGDIRIEAYRDIYLGGVYTESL